MQGNSISVERIIEAPARQIFALIADAGKHPSFDGSGTVDHSALSSQPLTLGSKFGMSMRARPESSPCPSGGRYPHGLIGAGSVATNSSRSPEPKRRRHQEPAARWCVRHGTSQQTGTADAEDGLDAQRSGGRMRATLERIAALLKP
ncbi:MAG: SRPBCC family protein [Mycobacterium sp.]